MPDEFMRGGGCFGPNATVLVAEDLNLAWPHNGTEITEWHPLFNETTMRWQFPNMIGQRVIVNTQYVYNFVLAPGFPTILVDGIPCAALGHGLEAPIVAHLYWGTAKVVQDLMTKPGWAEGKVVLPAGKKSAWEPEEKQ